MYNIKCFKKKRKLFVFLWTLTIIVIVIFSSLFFVNRIRSGDLNNKQDIEVVIQKSMNEVVGITSTNGESTTWGSGVVVSKDGFIATNEHVTGDKTNCVVSINNDTKLSGKVLWYDTNIDLAIVKVDFQFDSEASIIDNEEIKVGQDIYAIGNPIGIEFEKTVTSGVVSGIHRSVEFVENETAFYLNNLIQFDAEINSGSSGGALINDSGQLIGITTIKITSASGMSFAIPADLIRVVADQLKENETYQSPKIKLTVYDKYTIGKVNPGINLDNGVFISQVEADSNAEKSGLRAGDVVEWADGYDVKDVADFRKIIFSKNVGDVIKLKIRRDKKMYYVDVALE